MKRDLSDSLAARFVAFAALAFAALPAAAVPPVDGMALVDALDVFRARGVEVLYSTALVADDMRVDGEPSAEAPAHVQLAEVLRPHGLALEPGPQGIYIVVRADAVATRRTGNLFGIVRQAGNAERVEGARVLVRGQATYRATTGNAGHFSFSDLKPGDYDVVVLDATETRGERVSMQVEAGRTVVALIDLDQGGPMPLEAIVVNASQWQLFDVAAGIRPVLLGREEMLALPKLGDDVLRTVDALPGTASGGLTARTNIRGGAADEVLLRFDGLRLYDPFHLKDFQGITSLVDGRATSALEVYTGGFPARYGERMSGVVEIRSLEPDRGRHFEVGFSFFNSSLLTSGIAFDGDLDWLVSVRRGNTDIFLDRVNSQLGDPVYFDAVGKLSYRISDDLAVTASVLRLSDDVRLADSDSEEVATAAYDDAYYWLTIDQRIGRLRAKTLLSHASLSTDRDGVVENDSLANGWLRDRQRHRIDAIQTDWHWPVASNLAVDFGVEYRSLDGSYAFDDAVEFLLAIDGTASDAPSRSRSIRLEPSGEAFAAYGSVRWQPVPRLTSEIGLRWATQSLTVGSDDSFSPRLGLRYELGERTWLRAGWGRFFQPERIDELQVADGVTTYAMSQSSEHLIVGIEHRFESGLTMRAEAYEKRMGSLRPRYENLVNRFVVIPELQPDRLRIAPDRAIARGIELYLKGRHGDQLNWWFGYAWSTVRDRLPEGKRPRTWDQRHAVDAGLTWSGGPWQLSVSTGYHTGWPSTPLVLSGAAADGRPRVVQGLRNSDRLAPFHTIDARLERRFDFARGRLTLFGEVTNAAGRNNPCCVDYDIESEDGPLVLEQDTLYWLGVLPSLGFLFEFR